MKNKIALKDFKIYYNEFVQILLYTVTVPYLCMCGIDYAIEKGESKEKFAKALKILDPLRGFTTYPKLERSMLTHFWNLLAKETGISDHDLLDKLTPKEITEYIKGKDLPSIDELKARKEWCVFWHDTNKEEIVFEYEKSILNSIPILNEEIISTDKIIKGTVAFPGYAKGIVKRVDKAKDMDKYNPGDIIVSINTSPDLMPVLRTCSAIVSDEGGVMCHAAIVSREMKKPCIIGTRIATKVLNDGDLIEVDANKGIVKILKRKE